MLDMLLTTLRYYSEGISAILELIWEIRVLLVAFFVMGVVAVANWLFGWFLLYKFLKYMNFI